MIGTGQQNFYAGLICKAWVLVNGSSPLVILGQSGGLTVARTTGGRYTFTMPAGLMDGANYLIRAHGDIINETPPKGGFGFAEDINVARSATTFALQTAHDVGFSLDSWFYLELWE